MVTIIADRESDIYEEWDRIPDAKTHLLTHVCRDRKLASGALLYDWLDQQAPRGCYVLPVTARPAKAGYVPGCPVMGKRTAHDAYMEARYGEMEIPRPAKCQDKAAKKSIKLWVVEVKEQQASVFGDEEPIHWRLLTTHRLESVEAVLQLVD